MAKLRRTRGIVLTARDVQETDRLAEILTAREGKVAVLAKRARRLESPYGAILEPGNGVELIYYVREGPCLLKEASLVRHRPGLRRDAGTLGAAMEGLAFAAARLPERSPEPAALKLVGEFLEALDEGTPPGAALLAFELKLLGLLGHGPHLSGCVRCGAEEDLTWSPDEGLLCRRCGGTGAAVPQAVWRGMRMLSHLPLRDAGRLRMAPGDLQHALRLIRSFPGSLVRRA